MVLGYVGYVVWIVTFDLFGGCCLVVVCDFVVGGVLVYVVLSEWLCLCFRLWFILWLDWLLVCLVVWLGGGVVDWYVVDVGISLCLLVWSWGFAVC